MNHTGLYYFTVAAEELNITRAAAKLFISQQSLSEHIRKLEKQYDAVFFTRGGRLALTSQGERMLRYAREVLEALSRGAAYAVFVEQGKAQARIIQENIEFTKFERESMLLQTNVSAGIFRLSPKYRFDLIFADPPYKSKVFPQLLTDLSEARILKPEGLVILETDKREETEGFRDYGFSVVREKVYKTNKHVFLQSMEEKP